LKQGLFEIISNREIARNTYEMRLAGDVSAITTPGQFVNIKLDGHYLRRPMSVCDVDDGALTIIYKAVGRGTTAMARMGAGGTLDLLTGLGNGFDVSKSLERPLLIGGGAGIPPLYLLANRLLSAGARPIAILGFNENDERFYEDKFQSLGIEVRVCVGGGAPGCIRGFVTDAMREDAPYVFTCGPEGMLRAVHDKAGGGQFSFEARMGCGFGACLGCSCRTKYENKRICVDGPVLEREEIVW
jgi:dihydroorotate dehydrogenase electron transfer subunit